MVKSALAWNASHRILAHNHPSEDATPSPADRLMTQELRTALLPVEVALIDHIVVAPGAQPVSMARLGLLEAA